MFATCCTDISDYHFLLRLKSVTPAGHCAPMHSAAFNTSIQACWQPTIPCHVTLHTFNVYFAKCRGLREQKPDCYFCREYYTIDHLTRLKQFEAQTPYNEAKCSDYCKDYHVQPCRACTTCHFCRCATHFATNGAQFVLLLQLLLFSLCCLLMSMLSSMMQAVLGRCLDAPQASCLQCLAVISLDECVMASASCC